MTKIIVVYPNDTIVEYNYDKNILYTIFETYKLNKIELINGLVAYTYSNNNTNKSENMNPKATYIVNKLSNTNNLLYDKVLFINKYGKDIIYNELEKLVEHEIYNRAKKDNFFETRNLICKIISDYNKPKIVYIVQNIQHKDYELYYSNSFDTNIWNLTPDSNYFRNIGDIFNYLVYDTNFINQENAQIGCIINNDQSITNFMNKYFDIYNTNRINSFVDALLLKIFNHNEKEYLANYSEFYFKLK